MPILCQEWNKKALKGIWEVTAKIDGVRALSNGKNVVSRSGKPLANLDHLAHTFTDAEVFLGNFKKTMKAVRTFKIPVTITANDVYSIVPTDPRLLITTLVDPSAEEIQHIFDSAVKIGFEGIVLKKGDTWFRVKAHETFDVPCEDFLKGEGHCADTLGAIVTPMGRVGTGFDLKMRDWIWKHRKELKGIMIEVECNRLTEEGKFRHAAFKRFRWDKTK